MATSTRRRRRRNPLYRAASGRFTGRATGRRVRRHRRHRSNPVVRATRRPRRRNAWRGAPRAHARAARKGWRRRHRRRSNPTGRRRHYRHRRNVWINDHAGHARAARKGWRRRSRRRSNPVGRRRHYRRRRNPNGVLGGVSRLPIVGPLFERATFQTVASVGVGAVATTLFTPAISKMLTPATWTEQQKANWEPAFMALTGALLSFGLGFVKATRPFAGPVLVGGGVAAVMQGLNNWGITAQVKNALGLQGFGDYVQLPYSGYGDYVQLPYSGYGTQRQVEAGSFGTQAQVEAGSFGHTDEEAATEATFVRSF